MSGLVLLYALQHHTNSNIIQKVFIGAGSYHLLEASIQGLPSTRSRVGEEREKRAEEIGRIEQAQLSNLRSVPI